MRTLKIYRTRTAEVFYGQPIGVIGANSVKLELDQSYQARGFNFKTVVLDVESGATILPDFPGILSDEFILEMMDLPRLQEFHCLAQG